MEEAAEKGIDPDEISLEICIQCETFNRGTVEPWNCGTVELWNCGTLWRETFQRVSLSGRFRRDSMPLIMSITSEKIVRKGSVK